MLSAEEMRLNHYRWKNNFFCWLVECCVTRDEGDMVEPKKKFPAYRYLKEIADILQSGEKVLFEKSRQLLLTHIMSGYYLWSLLYKPYCRLAIMSQKEDQVVDLIETRIKSMYEDLPSEYPWPDLKVNRLRMVNEVTGGIIEGHTSAGNSTRGKTYTVVWLDEFGFQEEQEKTLKSALPASEKGQLVVVSTPALNTVYEDLAVKEVDGSVPVEHVMKGFEVRASTRGWKLVRLHFTAHPDRRNEEYRQNQIKRNTQRIFDIEYDLKWFIISGKPVFGTFKRDTYVKQGLEAVEGVPLELGWDFGGHYPACVLTQKTPLGQHLILDAIMVEDEDLYAFMDRVHDLLVEKYANFIEDMRFYCDPAGNSINMQGTAPPAAKLLADHFGREVKFGKTKPADRAFAQNIMMNKMVAGEPAILIADNCGTFIDINGKVEHGVMIKGFEGGYVYDKPKGTGTKASMKPKNDKFFEHLFDAWGYVFIHLFPGYMRKEHTIRVREPSKSVKVVGGQVVRTGRARFNYGRKKTGLRL